jgi:hypothetical protein
MSPILHFGLGNDSTIDEIKVSWPDGTQQVILNPIANQLLTLDYSNNEGKQHENTSYKNNFNDITSISNIDFAHTEDLYDDYLFEPLLPYKYSMLGGALAVGDVNGDGLEDFYAGNAAGSKSILYIQNSDATFVEQEGPWDNDSSQEDISAVFYDFDSDGDLDLYVTSGGNENQDLEDRLYINTKEGFVKSKTSLPQFKISSKTIAICDYDKDGLMDLFVGGRNVPGNYPTAATSFLLRNIGGKDRELKFEIMESPFGKDSDKIGMVTDAVWADLDGDTWEELILTGEWMPITVYQNDKGKLRNKTEDYQLGDTKGWWYSLHAVDIDQDGDLDLVAGNLGLNYKYKSTKDSPFEVYSADFDENGSNDIVFTYHKKGKLVPLRGLECSSQQVPAIAVRYKTYRDFAKADLVDIYGEYPLKKALHYKTDTFAHLWFENKNGKSFSPHQLPNRSQLSSINSIASIDYNNDKYPDLLLVGNLYQAEVETPRNDAGIGLVLVGSATGFKVVDPIESGLFIRGDIKSIAPIKLANGKKSFLLGANNEKLRLIEFKK